MPHPDDSINRTKSLASTQRRRQFLRATGAIGLFGLAGCGGDGDGGENTPTSGDPGNGDTDTPTATEASSYPENSITHIVPYSQGGGTDTASRQILPIAADELGVPIEIENIPGSGSLRGIGELINSQSDGYTMGGGNIPIFHIAQLQQDPSFDAREMEPVAAYLVNVAVAISHPSYELDSFQAVKDAYNSGEISNIGGQDPGHNTHLRSVALKQNAGVEWENYVAYGGSGETQQAVLQDEVPFGWSTDVAVEELVNNGDLDIPFIAASQGSTIFPDTEVLHNVTEEVPTATTDSTKAMWAPPGTPDDICQTYSDAIKAAVESEEAQSWADNAGQTLFYEGPEDLAARSESAWDEVPGVLEQAGLLEE